MKISVFTFVCLSVLCCAMSTFADVLVTLNNGTIAGTVIQTNGGEVLLVNDYAAFNFPRSQIKEIKTTPAAKVAKNERLPNFKKIVLFLSKQSWATNLTPIPATVIDKGILRNVPYSSFHCGIDYEVNVYGELDHPAGIEIGVYRSLLDDYSAKSNCLKFISDLLSQKADKGILAALDLRRDLKKRDGLTFEVTPPTAEDAYNGWWVSVYSEQKLNLARASEEEMGKITVPKADIAMSANGNGNLTGWSPTELKFARKTPLPKISFTTKSGIVVSNADVVSIRDGVSLVWEMNGGEKAGIARLEDLPKNLRVRFGYNPAKTAAADKLDRERKRQWAQVVAKSAQSARQTQAPNPNYGDYSVLSSVGSYLGYPGGGRVYVHGYFRRNGTYVHAYTRRYPHRR